MASWTRFLVFIAIIAIVVFVFAANFAVLVGFGIALLIGVAIAAGAHEGFGGWVGEAMNAAGRNNNLRLYALIGLTAITFIGAMKYGAGEPLFATSSREIREEIAPFYNGTTTNTILYGKAESNNRLENRRSIAETQGSADLKPQKRQAGESAEEYNKKIANYLSQGAFADDKGVDELVYATTNHLTQQPRTEESFMTIWMRDTGRSWFLWQLSFVFLFLSILYAPFAFRDEALSFINNRLEGLEAMRDANGSAPQPATPTPAPAGAGHSVTSGLSGIARIITVDAFMEIFYKIIKRLLGAN